MSERNQRGTEAELAGLHGLLSQYFSARLNSGEALTSSELNVIRQFLKDNGIDCVGSENLPSFDDDMDGQDSTGLLN